jgi:SET domain-containing protein
MLLVRTRLDRSPIEGIGLFAAECIPRGAIVWQFAPGFDLVLTQRDIRALSLQAREQVERYAYLDRRTGELILCGDDARFFNHSDHPNVVDARNDPGRCVASRDISMGEELVCDYYEFDVTAAEKLMSEASLAPH